MARPAAPHLASTPGGLLAWTHDVRRTLWLTGWRTLWFSATLVVLALSPSHWTPPVRYALKRQMVRDTGPVLPGFTALAALLTLIITRIVIITASSYGLSQYALEMVIRVLVLELLPLIAALFVALRCTIPSGAALARIREEQMGQTADSAAFFGGLPVNLPPAPVLGQAIARMVSGLFAGLTLAALTSVMATVLAYLAVYGLAPAGFEPFTRVFGRVFDGPMSLILVLKTLAFALAVAVIPMASALQDGRPPGPAPGGAGQRELPDSRDSREVAALRGLVRLFAVLLLLEAASLVGNYY